MGLAADLDEPPPYRPTKPCTFRAWIETLAAGDALSVRAAVARTQGDPLYWSTPALNERLQLAGWQGSGSTVGKHRTNRCMSCRVTS